MKLKNGIFCIFFKQGLPKAGFTNPDRSIVSLHYIRLALIGLLLNQSYGITSHLHVKLSIVIVINIVWDPYKFNSMIHVNFGS
jgi:hypothetical protein